MRKKGTLEAFISFASPTRAEADARGKLLLFLNMPSSHQNIIWAQGARVFFKIVQTMGDAKGVPLALGCVLRQRIRL